MITCPACFRLLEILTSVHCQKEHGLNKQEFIMKYGKPESISIPFVQHPEPSNLLNDRDYTNFQIFDLRFRSVQRHFHADRS